MSDQNALVPVQQGLSLQDTLTLGKVLAASKRFSDATSAEQAVVKVLAGQELGFGPIASMTGIYVLSGRVALSANMMAQAVKRSTRYDYRVIKLDDEVCEIAYFENAQELGRSRFTKEDAQRAGTQNMGKFPRNMLFARAMSNGVKWYCPDVFQTGVYTPEELGAQVDGEGEIINITPTETQPTTAETGSNGEHWIKDPYARKRFWAWAKGDRGMNEAEVHEALGVEHVEEFAGDKAAARAAINDYIDAKVAAEMAAQAALEVAAEQAELEEVPA